VLPSLYFLMPLIRSRDARTRQEKPDRLVAIDRVEEWTRERFGLAGGSAVHVWEISCAVPGCPPRETVVGFRSRSSATSSRCSSRWKRSRATNLPPAWFKVRSPLPGELDCDCC